MNGKYLLDTSIVVALFTDEPIVSEQLSETEGILLPITVLGELYYGASKSSRTAENMHEVERFAGSMPILPYDEATAVEYGRTKNQLMIKGRPIPENDVWIAALARQHRLTLITRDAHFKSVDGLKVEFW